MFFHLLKNIVYCPLVGFKGNLSLLDYFFPKCFYFSGLSLIIQIGLLKRYKFCNHPFETCGFFNIKIKGNHHVYVAMFRCIIYCPNWVPIRAIILLGVESTHVACVGEFWPRMPNIPERNLQCTPLILPCNGDSPPLKGPQKQPILRVQNQSGPLRPLQWRVRNLMLRAGSLWRTITQSDSGVDLLILFLTTENMGLRCLIIASEIQLV